MAFLDFVNSIGGVLAAIFLVISVIVGAKYLGGKAEKDKDKNTINTYKENAEAVSQLLETRNKEIGELKLLHEENLKRIQLAESKADVLEKQVTQAPSINKLAVQIGNQHTEMMKQMGAMTQELGNIAKALPSASIIKVDGKGK